MTDQDDTWIERAITALRSWPTPRRRRWLYRVVLAIAPLSVAYGVISDSQAALWISAAAALLGGSVALPNVSDE